MILPDTNLLLHAYNTHAPEHVSAKAWWETTLNDRQGVGLAWMVLLGFLRISTKPTIFRPPLTVPEATEHVRAWLEFPNVEVIAPGLRHAEILFELLKDLGAGGNLTMDAHLAALAIEYNAEIASTDTDFARFPKVRRFNPIAPRRRR